MSDPNKPQNPPPRLPALDYHTPPKPPKQSVKQILLDSLGYGISGGFVLGFSIPLMLGGMSSDGLNGAIFLMPIGVIVVAIFLSFRAAFRK